MLSGVSILCFAASYCVAFVLEVSRLVFRSGVRGAVMLGFAGAGILAHTAFLYYRAVETAGPPLSSERDWCLLAAWAMVAVYLYLVYYHPHAHFGLFLLPLALGLIAAGRYLADEEPFARGPASQVWGMIHGVSLLLVVVAMLLGFAAALMYLGQVRRLKHKVPPDSGLKLPSLEWLRRTNSRAMVAAMLLLGVGVASGTVLNMIGSRAAGTALPWHDPLVLSTNLVFVWLMVAAAIGTWYRPAQTARKVAYLTLVSFVLLLIVLAMLLLPETRHGGGSGKWEVERETSAIARGGSPGRRISTLNPQPSTLNPDPSTLNPHFPLLTSLFPLPSALRPLPSSPSSPGGPLT